MGYVEDKLAQITSNYKLTPATLAHKLNPNWIPAKHLLYVSGKIASAIHKGNGRLIISAPPRHGKSELVTTNVPIWVLERFPDKEVILTSYGAELSTDFGRKVRDIVTSNEALLDMRVRQDASKASNWSTTMGGSMRSIGLGGSITGRGADILIIDDYIKEVKEALSQAHHEYVWNWFVSTAMTRLEPGGTVIIIATRWHHNDLIGRILKHKGIAEGWDYIRLPAFAEENDVLGRTPGEPLFRSRYDVEALAERQITLGTYWFNAMYQQDPKDDNSKVADKSWLQTIETLEDPDNCRYARVWDLASTANGGDYTVGTLMAAHNKTEVTTIMNVVRKQLSPGAVESLIRATALADGYNTIIYIEQEPGSSGKLLFEYLKNTVLPEFTVMSVPASESKLVRSQPFLAACEAGKVVLLKGSWNELFLDEFDAFPDGSHDDQVDTTAMGYERLIRKRAKAGTFGRGTNIVTTGRNQLIQPGKRVVFGRTTQPTIVRV